MYATSTARLLTYFTIRIPVKRVFDETPMPSCTSDPVTPEEERDHAEKDTSRNSSQDAKDGNVA